MLARCKPHDSTIAGSVVEASGIQVVLELGPVSHGCTEIESS